MSNRIIASGLIAAALLAAAGCATTGQTGPGKPEYMVVGIDTKATWGEDGKVQNLAPGKDAVTIVDIGTDPANPKIAASLPLMNSVFGPPTNLAITPNGQLALVANSMDWVADGPGWKASPDTKLYVIDLTEPSYVLRGIGLDDAMAHASLRFSLGRFTTGEDIEFAIETIGVALTRLRDAGAAGRL